MVEPMEEQSKACQVILYRSFHALPHQLVAQSVHETTAWRSRTKGGKEGGCQAKEANKKLKEKKWEVDPYSFDYKHALIHFP